VQIDLEDRPAWDRLSTASYGEVARMIGRAGAARAVGAAVGRNPLGLVIPCHRVIAGDGSLGGYGGGWWGGRQSGLELKRDLLGREGVHIRRGGPIP
jgi:O-6-methylguanine DNA methyltransferase